MPIIQLIQKILSNKFPKKRITRDIAAVYIIENLKYFDYLFNLPRVCLVVFKVVEHRKNIVVEYAPLVIMGGINLVIHKVTEGIYVFLLPVKHLFPSKKRFKGGFSRENCDPDHPADQRDPSGRVLLRRHIVHCIYADKKLKYFV